MTPRYVELCFFFITLGMLLFLQSALSSDSGHRCTKTKPFYKLDEVSSTVGVEHKRESKAKGRAWRLEVVHRDTLLPANARPSYERRWEETRKRDAARIRGLEQQIERRLNKSVGSYAKVAEDLGAGVVSGLAVGSGEYFTRIGVGTPAREQYMVIDTGSDVTWIQCMPCRKCYRQMDPIFNPYSSASFSALSCNSDACSQLDVHGCSRSGGCAYRIDYGDGSYTIGVMATETLTFDDTYVRYVAIGCGRYNTGLFVGAAGLLGLGAGPLSLPSQLGEQLDGVFSYCLVDRYSESSGTLEFGAQSVPKDSFLTPMAKKLPSSYLLLSLPHRHQHRLHFPQLHPGRRLLHRRHVGPWGCHPRLRHYPHLPPDGCLRSNEGRFHCGYPTSSQSRGKLRLRHLLRSVGPT
jgi:hypothetical protein